jgi:hypothetical protein
MKLIKSFISVLVFGLIFASCENPNISNYYNNINQDNGGEIIVIQTPSLVLNALLKTEYLIEPLVIKN